MATGITVDNQNNVFVVGSTRGSLFQPNSGGIDAFCTRYNSDGSVAWNKQIGTGRFDQLGSIAKDSLGNIYVAGFTFGNPVQSNLGSADAYLIKYDSNGNQLWARQFGTSDYDGIMAICCDGQDNIIAVGMTQGSLFEPNSGPDNNGNSVYDAFVVKYDSNGN